MEEAALRRSDGVPCKNREKSTSCASLLGGGALWDGGGAYGDNEVIAMDGRHDVETRLV
jgi:hypothetical protein